MENEGAKAAGGEEALRKREGGNEEGEEAGQGRWEEA